MAFTFFVSLSAGDNVLPSYSPYGGQEDAMSHYIAKGKKQRSGVLSILGSALNIEIIEENTIFRFFGKL